MIASLLQRSLNGELLSRAELAALLAADTPEEMAELRAAAYEVKRRTVGTRVYLRGLIELSNRCTRDCLYCGIRRSNREVERFELSLEEITAAAALAADFGYGSVVLQSGERRDTKFTDFIARAVEAVRALPGIVGLTLSCGEQSSEVYRRWRNAGATRYLLRIESSNPELFAAIHPPNTDYHARVEALYRLRECDFQVGTGVMIGLPDQSCDDLAGDIEFFRKLDIDMIGMGPWLPHHAAPLRDRGPETPERARRRLELSLRMIAATRLQLRDVNIASTTALQAIDQEHGRELGLLFGANVVMPNTGGVEHRKDYTLYDNKPSLDENAVETRDALERSIGAVGETIAYHQDGTPLHYLKRKHPSAEAN